MFAAAQRSLGIGSRLAQTTTVATNNKEKKGPRLFELGPAAV